MTKQTPNTQKNILVIKLGALGDFIQACGPMAAIRKHHANAHITLLTTPPFEKFACQTGYFNDIWIDEKPRWNNFLGWLSLRKRLNEGGFERVYDLQNNDRSACYMRLFAKRPEWVGAAKGASHRNASPERTAGHAFDGHVQTLKLAGITDVQIDPLDWMQGDISAFGLSEPYILLVPGCAPSRPEKRWPSEQYGVLAQKLSQDGYQPVVLGSSAEASLGETIAQKCPQSLNLCGKTSLEQIAALARGAAQAIGNDTGPMHIIAATGCPSLVLFSEHSNPVRHAPKGKSVQVKQCDNLDDLPADSVYKKVQIKG